MFGPFRIEKVRDLGGGGWVWNRLSLYIHNTVNVKAITLHWRGRGGFEIYPHYLPIRKNLFPSVWKGKGQFMVVWLRWCFTLWRVVKG